VKRLLSLVVLSAVVIASGCESSPSAATVNGSTITQNQLNTELAQAAAPEKGEAPTPENQPVQCALDLQSNGSFPAVTGAGDDTVTAQFAGSTLESLVLLTLEKNALARRHVAVTTADIAAAKNDYESQLEESESEGSGPPCGLQGTQLTNKLPSAFLDQEATSLAYQEKMEEVVVHVGVSPSDLMAYYRTHTANLTQVCLNLILADTAAAGQAVESQIAGGATFAAASQTAGVDSESPTGGAVSCLYPDVIANQFGDTLAGTIDALANGQMAPAPLAWQTQSQSGSTTTLYLVVQMRAHQLVPFAEVSSSIRQVLLAAGTSQVGTALNAMVTRAHIWIDPQYGGWSAEQGVTVPTSPEPAFLLNRTADQPPAAAPATSPLSGLSNAG
jgi:hypothetical protein